MAGIKRPPIHRIFFVQFAVWCVLLIALVFRGETAVISGIFGGAIALVPSLLFARYAFRYMGASQAADVAKSFYLGEGIKLVVTILGFALVFKYMPHVDVAALFGIYGILIVVQLRVAAGFNRNAQS
ncbi:MAG: ATP synthase subunit I [Cellvibrionaceae bacterium]